MATKATHSPLINIFAEADRIANLIGSKSDRVIKLLCRIVSWRTGLKVSTAQVYGHVQFISTRKVS